MPNVPIDWHPIRWTSKSPVGDKIGNRAGIKWILFFIFIIGISFVESADMPGNYLNPKSILFISSINDRDVSD